MKTPLAEASRFRGQHILSPSASSLAIHGHPVVGAPALILQHGDVKFSPTVQPFATAVATLCLCSSSNLFLRAFGIHAVEAGTRSGPAGQMRLQNRCNRGLHGNPTKAYRRNAPSTSKNSGKPEKSSASKGATKGTSSTFPPKPLLLNVHTPARSQKPLGKKHRPAICFAGHLDLCSGKLETQSWTLSLKGPRARLAGKTRRM